jgi:hypothetical protein
MRKIEISIETAQRWFNGNDIELKELAVQTYPELAKKELPKTWEELKSIAGYYVCSDSLAIETDKYSCDAVNKNVFFTKEQAEASIAMAKLSQVMAVYNDGWVANFDDFRTIKFTIVFEKGESRILESFTCKEFLTFKTLELAEEFLTNFKEDIETYFNF